jgi:hypothetical protein
MLPRLVARLLSDGHEAPLGEAVWHDPRVLVPGAEPQWDWQNVLTGEPVTFACEDGQPMLAVAEVLAHFPVALLVADHEVGEGTAGAVLERVAWSTHPSMAAMGSGCWHRWCCAPLYSRRSAPLSHPCS